MANYLAPDQMHTASYQVNHIDTQTTQLNHSTIANQGIRSLFNHPQNVGQIFHIAQNNSPLTKQIADRIVDCLNPDPLEVNRVMVSFHSPRGYDKCKHVFNPNSPAPALEPQSPSLLQYCLQAQQAGKPIEITLQQETYRIQLNDLEFHDGLGENDDGVRHFKGKLQLISAKAELSALTIDFLEMAPPFNGYALSAKNLIQCLRQIKRLRPQDQEMSQFSSAKGVCRSASLLVLDQFSELLANNTLNLKASIDQQVDGLIQTFRNNQGNQRLIPSQQVVTLKQACQQLYEEHQQQHEIESQEQNTSEWVEIDLKELDESSQKTEVDLEESDSESIASQLPVHTLDFVERLANPGQATDIQIFNATLMYGAGFRPNSKDAKAVSLYNQAATKMNTYFTSILSPLLVQTHFLQKVSGFANECWARVCMLSMLFQAKGSNQLIQRARDIKAVKSLSDACDEVSALRTVYETLYEDPVQFLFGESPKKPDSSTPATLMESIPVGSKSQVGYNSVLTDLIYRFAAGGQDENHSGLISLLLQIPRSNQPLIEEEVLIQAHRAMRLPCLIISKSNAGGLTVLANTAKPEDQEMLSNWFNAINQQRNQPKNSDKPVEKKDLEKLLSLFKDLPILFIQNSHYDIYLPRSHSLGKILLKAYQPKSLVPLFKEKQTSAEIEI